jgi:hypothetical protein
VLEVHDVTPARFLLAAIPCLSLLVASRPAGARECQYWSGNGPSVYSMKQGLSEGYAGAVDRAGLGGLRMGFRIDTQTSWNQALFDQYDALLAVAWEHGLDVMAIVLYESTPPGAGGQAQWNSGYDSTGMNAYVQAFVDTTKLLLTRYGDQIKYWEIWNEPNAWTNASYASDPTKAGGTYILPQVYAKMLAETYVQNKATIASKGLHLITGGLFAHDIGGSFSPATDYAQQVYANGVWDWMQANEGRRYPWDGFGYHIYIDQGGATSSAHVLQYVDAIQQLKVQQSDDVPLWITEFGWQAPKNMGEAQQAANLDTALGALESRGDVARTFVFKVDDYDDWGIFTSTWTAKAAVATYQARDKGCSHLPTSPLDAGAPAGGADASAADAGDHPGGDAGPAADAGASSDAGGGSGADAGSGGRAGADAGADAGPANADTATSGASGCGCRAAGDRLGSRTSLCGLLALLGLPALRRTRARARRHGVLSRRRPTGLMVTGRARSPRARR